LLLPAAICIVCLLQAAAVHGGENPDVLFDRVSLTAGFGYAPLSADVELPRDLRIHANHRDDTFLTGDPGETSLDRLGLNAIDFDLGLRYRLGYRNVAFLVHYTAKAPVGTSGRAERQQANDPRPPAEGSYVYTKLAKVHVGHVVGAGLALAVPVSSAQGFWLEFQGVVEIGRWNMDFEKGWTRFGQDEAEVVSAATGLYLLPRLGLSFGTRKWALFVTGGPARITLDHDVQRLANHTATGFEIKLGTRVAFRVKE
jgi:hypothetical protein